MININNIASTLLELLFIIGHLNILEQAKTQCEYLTVGVTTDDLCYERKKKKPIINQEDRIRIVKAIHH